MRPSIRRRPSSIPIAGSPSSSSNGAGGFVLQKASTPQWFKVIPFALDNPREFPPPKKYDQVLAPSDAYNAQAQKVLDYSANLTDEQKVIAEYWADTGGTELPPGHWALNAQFVSRRDGHTLGQDVKLFFAITNAVFDAGIASWTGKRDTDSVRPITAIHYLFTGKKVRAWAGPFLGTQIIDGADWQPYQATTVVTPPFQEWFSGHSVFSRAGAEILERFTGSPCFGDDYKNPAGASRVEPGVTPKTPVVLHWRTFKEASDQAGMSRRYGGIHFVHGDLAGRTAARGIAENAWNKAIGYFNEGGDGDDESIAQMQRRTHDGLQRFCRCNEHDHAPDVDLGENDQ